MLRSRLLLLGILSKLWIAQAFNVNCGSTARTSAISDKLFSSAKVKNVILPSIVDTICDFQGEAYCDSVGGGHCTIDAMFFDDDGKERVTVMLNKTSTVGQNGGSDNLGPCKDIMNQIISECIDGTKKVTEGRASNENVDYRILFTGSLPVLTNSQLQQAFIVPDDKDEKILSQLPQGLQDVINGKTVPGSAPTTSTTAPVASSTSSSGTPNTSDCQDDVGHLVNQINSNYGDFIDPNNANDAGHFFDSHEDSKSFDWWRIGSAGNAFLTLGRDHTKILNTFGVPVIKKSDVVAYIQDKKLFFCINANPKIVASQPQGLLNSDGTSPVGLTQICLADVDNYQKCSGIIGL